jgi:hypothetical protein
MHPALGTSQETRAQDGERHADRAVAPVSRQSSRLNEQPLENVDERYVRGVPLRGSREWQESIRRQPNSGRGWGSLRKGRYLDIK